MIREAIVEEMKRREWTPYRLAKESEVPQSRVYDFLSEGKDVLVPAADKMLAALNLKVVRGKSRKKA